MLNRKTVMALAAAMVMAALYGCSGSDNSGLKNDLEMYKEQVADLTAERDARAMITPEALRRSQEMRWARWTLRRRTLRRWSCGRISRRGRTMP